MMKHIGKAGLVVFLVVPMLLMPSAVRADDGDINVGIGITTPGTANVWTDIFASNANVWINGQNLNDYQMGVQSSIHNLNNSIHNGVNNGVPNGQYSGASTGTLPVPGNWGTVAGDDVTPPQLIGWLGYFSPDSNEDPRVYKGSGCGGTWGVCDGWPDMWARRQIAGIADEYAWQREQLDTVINALSKVILITEDHNSSLNGNGGLSDVRNQLLLLEDVSLGLSILQQEHAALEATVQKQRADYDTKFTIMASVSAFVLVCLTVYIVLLTLYIRRHRSRAQ